MLTDDLLTRLREALGDDRVLTSDEDVDDRRHDYWVLSHLQSWRGTFEDRPGAVVRPRSTAEVQAVVRLAAETGTAVVPFGLGSGVCGGILPDRSMLLVDLSSMNRVREVDEVNLVATFDAGVNGRVAEEAVAELGLTIGHWPQSIAVSTVGGWVSTRAAGQFSTAYGNIEDMVYSLEVVLPDGTLVNLGRAPRASSPGSPWPCTVNPRSAPGGCSTRRRWPPASTLSARSCRPAGSPRWCASMTPARPAAPSGRGRSRARACC